jgi:aspartyl-tRNA(Asn)/glutamyl-tRNA(Gln) amidotransferase subunit A
MELCDRTALELAGMLREKEVSSREITESVFKRIEEKEKTINAYITETRDIALEQADNADRRLKNGGAVPFLNGIPVAVKDILCTKGIRTTCGSKILYNFIPTYNATAVERVLADGAVLIGKTNMDEFGMGSSTEHSIAGPTRNPIDPNRVAGGSSGGSAAAVASGETVLAIGTDTGGSIRLPSAYCGIAGIKPTYGRVSRYGVISYASSLDQVGPLGRNVADCAELLNVICGHDRLDTTSARIDKPDFTASLNKGIKGIKIGMPEEYFVEGLDQGIRDRILEAVRLLEKNGADIVEVSLPHNTYCVSTYYLIATAEASSNLARYDGVKYGFRSEEDALDLINMYEATRSQGFGTEVKRRIMLGTYVLSAGYYDAYYLKAQKVRALIKEDFDRAFEKVDCLLAPVSPCLPFKLGEKMEDPLQMYLVDIYTASISLSGLPGMSVYCGSVDGLPVGLQIIGRAFDEEMVLRVANAYETLSKDDSNDS